MPILLHDSAQAGCGPCRGAIHASLLALYGLGGYLVSKGLMPLRVLLSAVGFTFSLVFATQGCVQTFSDARRAIVSLRRCWCHHHSCHSYLCRDSLGRLPSQHFMADAFRSHSVTI